MNKTLIAIAVVAVLAVGGYFAWRAYSGGYNKPSSGGDQGNQSQTVETSTVTLKDFKVSPVDIKVKAGTEVTFKNEDSTNHTITGDGFDSGNIKSGETYKKKFDSAGAYEYHCSLHPSMKGRVVVE